MELNHLLVAKSDKRVPLCVIYWEPEGEGLELAYFGVYEESKAIIDQYLKPVDGTVYERR